MKQILLALTLSISLAGPLAADDHLSDPDRITKLVGDLGSPIWNEREAANRELATLGEDARVSLEAATCDKDPEIRHRARQLLARLDEQVEESRYEKFASGFPTHIFIQDDFEKPWGGIPHRILLGPEILPPAEIGPEIAPPAKNIFGR